MHRNLTAALILLLGLGCGGSNSSDPATFSVTWGPFEVPAEQESTQCVVKRLGNVGPIHVHELFNELGATSHHFIVYRLSEGEERPEPFDCTPFIETLDPSAGAPLMITQKKEDRLVLPEGVAYTLQPNQLVRLELHYINVSASPQMAQATSTFVTIPENEMEHEADIVFMGSGDISLEPGEGTVGPTFLNPPSILDDANFFAITGHEHQWGTSVTVEAVDSPSGEGTMVYDVADFIWDEPETVVHDPPFTLPPGGGFRLQCDYDNQSGHTVGFGTSVDDEMCFFWAYYYPSQGSVVCINDAFGFDLCCPGSALCDFASF